MYTVTKPFLCLVQGEPGTSGSKGTKGERGMCGPAGILGSEGPSGPAGDPGLPGLPGTVFRSVYIISVFLANQNIKHRINLIALSFSLSQDP